MGEQQIELWYDDASGDDPTWCVSLCESAGDEIRCIETHEDRADARRAALAAADKRKLVAYERDTCGVLSRL